jgi:hypothetical protein
MRKAGIIERNIMQYTMGRTEWFDNYFLVEIKLQTMI